MLLLLRRNEGHTIGVSTASVQVLLRRGAPARAINVDLERSLFLALILAALNGDFITEFAMQTVAERRGQLRVTSADSTFYFNEQLRRRQSCVT